MGLQSHLDSKETSGYALCMGTGPKREQRHTLRERLAGFARDVERFPSGPRETGDCTEYAYLIVEHFGGQIRRVFSRS
jgi:hypothetical protein